MSNKTKKQKVTAKEMHFRKQAAVKSKNDPLNKTATIRDLLGLQHMIQTKTDLLYFMLVGVWNNLDELKIIDFERSNKATKKFASIYTDILRIIQEHANDELSDGIIDEAIKLEGITEIFLKAVFSLERGEPLRRGAKETETKKEENRIVAPTPQQKNIILAKK